MSVLIHVIPRFLYRLSTLCHILYDMKVDSKQSRATEGTNSGERRDKGVGGMGICSTYSVYLYENGLRNSFPYNDTFHIKDSNVNTQLGGGVEGQAACCIPTEVGRYLGRNGGKNKAPTLPKFPLSEQ